MRDLTDRELSTLYGNAGCLFCGSTRFIPGPCGGVMQNIECDDCGARYNVAEPGINIRVGQLLSPPSKLYTPRPPPKPDESKPNGELPVELLFYLAALVFVSLVMIAHFLDWI